MKQRKKLRDFWCITKKQGVEKSCALMLSFAALLGGSYSVKAMREGNGLNSPPSPRLIPSQADSMENQLFQLIEQGYFSESEKLISTNTVNCSARNQAGKTFLHVLIEKFFQTKGDDQIWKVIIALIEKGADLNLQEDNQGETPLHLAIRQAGEEAYPPPAVKLIRFLLVDHRADPNLPDNQGETVLHLAIRQADRAGYPPLAVGLIQFLLANKADLTIVNQHGQIPFAMIPKERFNEELTGFSNQEAFFERVVQLFNAVATGNIDDVQQILQQREGITIHSRIFLAVQQFVQGQLGKDFNSQLFGIAFFSKFK